MGKIESFTDLDAWKYAHKLALFIYKLTENFPPEERYALIDQMKRCSLSITSNLAEGFSRKGKNEKLQFYFMAKGSLTELQNQLLFSRDIGYLSNTIFQDAAQQTITVHKLLNGLLKSAQAKY